jgi:GNAT superfamily N-acetyltransferase
MRTFPPGWATDLAILELSGSTVEEHRDHLVVRSPHNPGFHWGNCIFVTTEDAVDDADRWVSTFGAAFPEASWVAIGLTRMPDAVHAWSAHGLELELDEVLTTETLPRQAPCPDGYSVRLLGAQDWEESVARAVAENDRTQEHEPHGFRQFAERRTRSRQALVESGDAAWFGAFAGATLVADLGIVRCGTTARYQDVGTDAQHRGRGLATHLLGVAARWSAERGCDRWVIVTEETNAAGRVYRSVGFTPDSSSVSTYRRPPH